MWRCRPPQQATATAPTSEGAASERLHRPTFELIGWAQGTLAWLQCLSWTFLPASGTLLLAAARSDGGASLWAGSREALARALPLTAQQAQRGAAVLEPWGALVEPDQRSSSSLAARLYPEAAFEAGLNWQAGPAAGPGPAPDGGSAASTGSVGQQRLVIAVGKSAGRLCVWISGKLGSGTDMDGCRAAVRSGSVGG